MPLLLFGVDEVGRAAKLLDQGLATWAPPVDIYETENELVVKADLPDLQEKDIDVRVSHCSRSATLTR